MKRLIFVSLISFTNFCASAQQVDLGSWNILNVKYYFGDKVSVFGEGQVRSLKFYSNFHYHELKGGINYKMNSNVVLTAAFGSYQTYKEGGNFVLPKKQR